MMNKGLAPGLSTLVKFTSILLAAWLLIHLFSIFGFFLAISYPIWWIINPKRTICIDCQINRESKSKYCRFCGEPVINGNIYPKNVRSIILNSISIVLLSFFSLLIVYFEYHFVSSFLPTHSNVSIENEVPGKYRLGETFPMKIVLTDINVPINTVMTDLSYDPSALEIIDISLSNSFATIFLENNYNNSVGFARITGGVPNPGYKGNAGLFATVYFKAKKPGFASVSFLDSSVVLANDGEGTNVLKGFKSRNFLILEDTVDEYQKNDENVIISSQLLTMKNANGDEIIPLYDPNGNVLGSTDIDVSVAMVDDKVEGSDDVSFLIHVLDCFIKIDKKILYFWKINTD